MIPIIRFMRKNWLISALSAAGEISSKRLVGMIMIMVALICIVVLVCTEGGSETVESLLQTVLIVAASLMGISSITGIWKGGRIDTSCKQKDNEPDNGVPKHNEESKP